jgi:hypothetical protein
MNFTKLNEDQAWVLYLRCQGNNMNQVAKKRNISESTAYAFQAKALEVLGIDGFKFLREDGCKEFEKLSNEDLENWEKRKYEIFGGKPETPTTATTATEKRPPRYLLYLVIPLLILGAYWIGTRQKTLATPEPQLITQIVVVSATPEPPTSSPKTPESTPGFTETPIDIVAIPPTLPVDTPTVKPTDIPTLAPTPAPTISPVLFKDDFDEGLLPEWNVLLGESLYVNGKLTTDSDLIMFTGDETWTDYSVTFEGHCSYGESVNGSGCYIGVRVLDTNNFIGYLFWRYEGVWFTVVDGIVEKVTGSSYRSVYYNPNHYRITVEGNVFSVYINGNLKGTVINTDYPSGGIGIKLRTKTSIDNLVITRLP